MFLVHGSEGSDKFPFEDRILEYIRDHPSFTVGDCSAALGIGVHAVMAAIGNLEEKGIVTYDTKDQPR